MLYIICNVASSALKIQIGVKKKKNGTNNKILTLREIMGSSYVYIYIYRDQNNKSKKHQRVMLYIICNVPSSALKIQVGVKNKKKWNQHKFTIGRRQIQLNTHTHTHTYTYPHTCQNSIVPYLQAIYQKEIKNNGLMNKFFFFKNALLRLYTISLHLKMLRV